MNKNPDMRLSVPPLKLAVVISTWTGSSPEHLNRLLRSMQRYPAGVNYESHLCANGLSYRLPADLAGLFSSVMIRENTGFNLGAWDHVWRRLSGYTHVLFLQDDCFVQRKNWLLDFVRCFQSGTGCGLVGENYNKGWDYPWRELTNRARHAPPGRTHSEEKIDRAVYYLKTLKDWGIDPGRSARHITTVVQFTAIAVLEAVDGYTPADSYAKAIAAEIGFSKKVEAEGYCLRQIGKHRHSRIGHPQWTSDDFFSRIRRSLKKRYMLSCS